MALALRLACRFFDAEVDELRALSQHIDRINAAQDSLVESGELNYDTLNAGRIERVYEMAGRVPPDARRVWRTLVQNGPGDASRLVFSGNMILDLHASASIIAETASAELELPASTSAVAGVDWGAGPGTCALGQSVAAKRHNLWADLCAVEVHRPVYQRMNRLVTELQEASGGLTVTITPIPGDATDLGLHLQLKAARRRCGVPLAFWASETWGAETPHPYVSEDGTFRWTRRPVHTAQLQQAMRYLDPFVDVVDGTLATLPDFVAKSRAKQLSVFPNFPNGTLHLFNPWRQTVRLRSEGAEPVFLHQVGQAYRHYESLGLHSRWPKPQTH